ncbi:putative Thyrotropin-releasing hormone-degrading ectoenzyme, partial [Hypsibius exemplaris]
MFTYWVVREAMSQDAFTTTHALSDPNVETIADIERMFSTITYAKGASILHMIKGLMQETPFFNALKQYVKVNADVPTRPELLMTELDKVYNSASDKLSERLSKWIYQKGYPVVTVSRNYDSTNPNDISYTQKRFLLPVAPGSSAPVLNETDTWDVPLTLISGAIKDDLQTALQAANLPCWVSSASEKLPDRCLTIFTDKPTVVAGTDQISNFIIANVQQFGFYRVNYDIRNWNRIIGALGAYTSG